MKKSTTYRWSRSSHDFVYFHGHVGDAIDCVSGFAMVFDVFSSSCSLIGGYGAVLFRHQIQTYSVHPFPRDQIKIYFLLKKFYCHSQWLQDSNLNLNFPRMSES